MSKVAKWRQCPVVGKQIKNAECGANRNSEYACPVDCEFNPFSPQNYDELLEMETRVDRVLLDLFREIAQTKPWLMSRFHTAVEKRDHLEANVIVDAAVFLDRDESGKSVGERFVEEGMPGLNNDQELLFKARMGIRPALLEVREVLDDKQLRCVDLLRPEEGAFLTIDRGMARQAVRFMAALVFTYSLPGIKRIHGAGYTVPDFGAITSREVLETAIAHAGGPISGAERDEFLLREPHNIIRIIADSWSALTAITKGEPRPETVPKSVAPKLLEKPETMTFEEIDSDFPDSPQSFLGGVTPRQAAASAKDRPRLIEMMKRHIRRLDFQNLVNGQSESIDWVLSELGLEEIRFPAPPNRPITQEVLDLIQDEEVFEDEGFGADEDLRTAPRLGPGPIDLKVAEARLNELMGLSARGLDQFEEFARAGGIFPNEITPVLDESLNEAEMRALEMAVIDATFIMVPLDHRIPEVNARAIQDQLHEFLEQERKTFDLSDKASVNWTMGILDSSSQPGILKMMSAMLLALREKDSAVTNSGVTLAIYFLVAYVNELDRQFRKDTATS